MKCKINISLSFDTDIDAKDEIDAADQAMKIYNKITKSLPANKDNLVSAVDVKQKGERSDA